MGSERHDIVSLLADGWMLWHRGSVGEGWGAHGPQAAVEAAVPVDAEGLDVPVGEPERSMARSWGRLGTSTEWRQRPCSGHRRGFSLRRRVRSSKLVVSYGWIGRVGVRRLACALVSRWGCGSCGWPL
eukprot:9474935-Pyramimonas_sp.AAC.2